MPSRKPAARRNPTSPSTVRPKLKAVPNAVAVRYCAGNEGKVRDTLTPFGEVALYRPQRMAVLERSPGVTSARVETALDDLKAQKAIEFITPVLLDGESNTRQVLTDEIVLRLKPGRTKRTLQTLGAAHGVTISRRNEFEPSQYVLKVPSPSGTQTLDIARSLDASDDVEFASPNFLTEIKR
jgi:hypothetical protein